MFKIVDNIPKDNERVALEEYYKFLIELYGINLMGFNPDLRYTTAERKLRRKEMKNVFFQSALSIVKNESNEMKFGLYCDEDMTKAIARFRIVNNELIVSDIIYLDYPTEDERKIRIQIILGYLEVYARELAMTDFYVEVPKFDKLEVNVALDNGLHFFGDYKSDKHRTYLLEKSIRKREIHEPTRSRRQTKGSF